MMLLETTELLNLFQILVGGQQVVTILLPDAGHLLGNKPFVPLTNCLIPLRITPWKDS
jgi:hypothetical protein